MVPQKEFCAAKNLRMLTFGRMLGVSGFKMAKSIEISTQNLIENETSRKK